MAFSSSEPVSERGGESGRSMLHATGVAMGSAKLGGEGPSTVKQMEREGKEKKRGRNSGKQVRGRDKWTDGGGKEEGRRGEMEECGEKINMVGEQGRGR